VDLRAALARFQDEAESRMTDTCRVTRAVAGSGDIDPVTGLPVTGDSTVIYGPTINPHKGKSRLRTGGTVTAGALRQSAGDVATQVASVLSVPVSAPRLLVDDRVEILSSADPSLPALVFTISGLVPGSQMTAQRVQVTAVID
jgi:hypothetical protein